MLHIQIVKQQNNPKQVVLINGLAYNLPSYYRGKGLSKVIWAFGHGKLEIIPSKFSSDFKEEYKGKLFSYSEERCKAFITQ